MRYHLPRKRLQAKGPEKNLSVVPPGGIWVRVRASSAQDRRIVGYPSSKTESLQAFLETNTVNIVLWGSGVEGFTEDGLCFSCSHASNRLDNAIYKMKVVEVLPENRVVSDLVKSGLYDQKLNKMILFETLGGGYSLNDYLKEGTFYKFVGVKEYKDRFGRKKSLPCLKEIPEDEYNAFAEERVRSQFDTW